MTRTTVDFGIDLGTTNSAIAVVRANDVEVFKNGTFELTPSVVNINKKGTISVGARALFVETARQVDEIEKRVEKRNVFGSSDVTSTLRTQDFSDDSDDS